MGRGGSWSAFCGLATALVVLVHAQEAGDGGRPLSPPALYEASSVVTTTTTTTTVLSSIPKASDPETAAGHSARSRVLLLTPDKDQVILGYNEKEGTWGTFGGHLEQGEESDVAAMRELTEETTITGADLQGGLVKMTEAPDAINQHWFYGILKQGKSATDLDASQDPGKEYVCAAKPNGDFRGYAFDGLPESTFPDAKEMIRTRLAALVPSQIEAASVGTTSAVTSIPADAPPTDDLGPYDVMLTHNWGPDETERDNHQRVVEVERLLEERGWNTWIDEKRMTGDVDKKMAEAVEMSTVIVVFITRRYMEKIMVDGDNCAKEFSHAARVRGPAMMVPVVMEQGMSDTKTWRGKLGLIMGDILYVPMWEDDVSKGVNQLSQEIAKRIKAPELGAGRQVQEMEVEMARMRKQMMLLQRENEKEQHEIDELRDAIKVHA